MSFTSNRAINRVNIHYAFQAFAQASGGIFILAFLLKAGVSIPMALLFEALLLAGRFVLRPAMLPLAKRFGVKPLLVTGTLITAAAFPLLSFVEGVGPLLWVLCAVSSLGYLTYWLNFHAYFAALGDPEHRGGQVGLREGIVAMVGIVAPLLGAWGLSTLGGKATFLAVGVVQALAVVPLIGLPNVPVAASVPRPDRREMRMGLALMVGDGLLAAGNHFVWLIALFTVLGESYAAFGGAAALAALAAAVGALVLGRHVDLGHGRRSASIAYGAAALVLLLRAASLSEPWLAVAANAAGALLIGLVTPVLMTPVYNLARSSPCVMRFHMATEGAWDVGGFVGCLLAAGLVAAGLPLSLPILISLGAVLALYLLLARYYGPRAP
ncbi:MAG: MFS transporter [Caulobacter sp.]|jgi:DHA1 family inner membrane transport protein|nr:MFS transporter [Caulobacter sp.]